MVYVALLRGINVGGSNKVEMAKLKATFENIGLQDIKTYINSGNIIFRDPSKRREGELMNLLEQAIEKDFNLNIKVLLRSKENILLLASSIPEKWVNDKDTKCDVMFLWEEFDSEKVFDDLTLKPGIDNVRYLPGAVVWEVDRKDVTKSGLPKVVGTKLYKNMTARNVNTLRKIADIMATYS